MKIDLSLNISNIIKPLDLAVAMVATHEGSRSSQETSKF